MLASIVVVRSIKRWRFKLHDPALFAGRLGQWPEAEASEFHAETDD